MAELPRVKIDYGNGALGQAVSSADGLLVLAVCGAAGVTKEVTVKDEEGKDVKKTVLTFELGKHYPLQNFAGLEELGVTNENNPLVYKTVKDFYTEAQEGTKVYIVGYDADLKMSDILDKNNSYLRNIIEITTGEVRGFVVTKAVDADDISEDNALDEDITAAMLNAQQLGDWAAEVKKAPLFVIVDGLAYNGDSEALENLTEKGYNRVGIVIGDYEKSSPNQAIGLIAGRIAEAPVQRNIGRVKDGALNVLSMYAGEKEVEIADMDTIHGKGYITFRTFTGFSGYYISDDPLATTETDDYRQLARRRTIDKAYRIAYPTLVEELLDEVPVNADGTITETYAAAFEQKVISAIATNMTARGELSADPSDDNDQGVEFTIDRTVNILATNMIQGTLRVRPYGYSKYIDVLLGFTVTNN